MVNSKQFIDTKEHCLTKEPTVSPYSFHAAESQKNVICISYLSHVFVVFFFCYFIFIILFSCSKQLDSNINLEFQKAKNLVDSGFVFIRRYENSSVLIKDFDKLAEKYSDCFYRNENSALDVCDGNIVSIKCNDILLTELN